MKTDNLNLPGERSHGIVRGHVGRARAGTPGSTYRDAMTTATEIVDLTIVGGTLTDNDDGTAVLTIGSGSGYTQAEADDLFLTRRDGEGHVVATTLASGAAVDLDVSAANVFDVTLTASCTITISNPPAAGVAGIIQVILRQGGVGSFTVTWPASVKWRSATGTSSGSAPTLYTAVGAQDDFELGTLDGGVTWGGERGGSATGGTVTSVALTVPAEFSVAGSPVTSAGTLAVTAATQSPNTVWAGPTSGAVAAPAFRALVAADIPAAVVSGLGAHVHVAEETHLSDGATVTWTLDNYYEPGSVIAWNTTTIARLLVTEVLPDKATVSAAGTTGDKIVFDYAATAA